MKSLYDKYLLLVIDVQFPEPVTSEDFGVSEKTLNRITYATIIVLYAIDVLICRFIFG